MPKSENHPSDQKTDEDLPFTTAEMVGPSTSANDHPDPNWPFQGRPPSYLFQEPIEMRNLRPPYHSPPPVAQKPAAPALRDGPFNFGFFKPQKDAKRKFFICLIVFLMLTIMALSVAFPIVAHKRNAAFLLQNTTVSVSATLPTTPFLTQLVSTTKTEEFLSTTTEVSSTTQVTTQTTLTSLLPNPTSVNNCWNLLADICANTAQVPSDTHSGAFGDCENVFGYFYCGVIQNLEKQGIFIIPADDSPFCFGMKAFCDGIHLGDPLGLHSKTKTLSAVQVIPVTKREVVETTTGNIARQLSRTHGPMWTSGLLPTDGAW